LSDFVPVLRPLLPRIEAITPYLALLDRSRIYANRGELNNLLESRLTALFDGPGACLTTAASGTAALQAAILAVAGRATEKKPLCVVAGYTFVATALAAEQCGYRVHLIDIDQQSWALDPQRLAKHALLDRAGVVIVTAPYGRKVSQSAWVRFKERTGLPVVIDAAASLESLVDQSEDVLGPIPLALSFHATKAFGVGEGGAIVCCDQRVFRLARAALNFGFDKVRETSVSGFNGKMSEYHAAIGLAELDGWPEKRANFRRVAEAYQQSAAARGVRIHVAPEVSSCYALFEAASDEEARSAQTSLAQQRIDYRLWYGRGLHQEPYFKRVECDSLPSVEALAPRLIGLPIAPDLPKSTVQRIVAALGNVPARFNNERATSHVQ